MTKATRIEDFDRRASFRDLVCTVAPREAPPRANAVGLSLQLSRRDSMTAHCFDRGKPVDFEMTPSEAHDSAWQRDPGHDEMQLAVMRWIERNLKELKFKLSGFEGPQAFALEYVCAEMMFTARGVGTMFADIAAAYTKDEEVNGKRSTMRVLVVLEIKPKIHSAGSVIRQVAMLEARLRRYGQAIDSINDFHTHPVVRANDPKAQILADLMQRSISTWDGERLAWLDPSASE